MIDNSTRYAGAWCVDSVAEAIRCATSGINLMFVPARPLGFDAFKAVALTAPAGSVVADLSEWGSDLMADEVRAFVERCASDSMLWRAILAIQTFDEPNNNGQPDAYARSVQADWYRALKDIDASKYVIVNYAFGPIIPDVGCIATDPGEVYDVAFGDYYPLTYGVTDAEAADNLKRAAAAVRALFPTSTPLGIIQQACGCSVDPGTAPRLRPIDGLLSAQHQIWLDSGCLASGISAWYGASGTLAIEDRSAKFVPTLMTELEAVIAAHRA